MNMKNDVKASCFGFWRYGNEFLVSALSVSPVCLSECDRIKQRISIVAYYLVGHSIELFLKAFLLGRGESIEVLRSRKFGHDLIKLLNEATRRKFGSCVKLNIHDKRIIKILNECYNAKEFEYIQIGYKSFPDYVSLVGVAQNMSKNLKNYAAKISAQ